MLVRSRHARLTIAVLLAAALSPVVPGAVGAESPSPAAVSTTAAGPGAPGVAAAFDLLPGFSLSSERRVTVRPTRYVAARVDLTSLRGALSAPEGAGASRGAMGGPVTLALPAPDGSTALFSVVEDSVMAPRLQAAHPELRTYAGTGITDPSDTIRLSLTPLGLHASVRNVESHRTWYVDPAYLGRGVSAHLSYLRSAVPASSRVMAETEPLVPPGARPGGGGRAGEAPAAPQRRDGELVTQRTYRLAFVTEQTYAAYVGTANVLATKVIQVNRADQIYMDDMAIKFVLAEGSDRLNLDTDAKAIGADGPCGASPCFTTDETSSCGGEVLDRNTFVAGQIVGADAFDIGHFGSGDGSGGVAYLGVVGGADKAGGCTALDPPAGDFYAIDFFAHEIGHQMGGNHTFDGASGSCAAPNRNAETAVEPGSGSSVMAYAGICFSDDLQAHTDPYFSQRTIDEFTATTTSAPTNLGEVQSVTLAGFGAGDTFQLTYPGAAPFLVTSGGNDNAAALQAGILALTGTAATVTGYDGATAVGPDGFTVTFTGTRDLARLGVAAPTGGTTGFVGVLQNGGPTTEGGTATVTTNHRPVAVAPDDASLPISTPFALTGTATDVDTAQQAGLTYLWEQNDPGLPGDPILGTGPGTLLGSPVKLAGPLFRVFGVEAQVSPEDSLLYNSPNENLADTDPTRSFPDIAQILAGTTNAEGPCPAATTDPTTGMEGGALDCYSEFLPDAAYAAFSRELNFRLTVRDGAAVGGGTSYDDVTLALDPTVGPFLVTSRSTDGTTATAGATESVTWDVAGTSAAAFAPLVRISVSLDGGSTFPYVVAASTPNDGQEAITLPGFNTSAARIKVEAVDNYFFDINGADFAITGGTVAPSPSPSPSPSPTPTPGPTPAPTTAPSTTITDGPARGAFVVGNRAAYAFSSSQPGSTFECSLDGSPTPCSRPSTLLSRLKPGDHVFGVAARNSAGQVDATPATARFSVAFNERILTRSTSGWRTVKDRRAYKRTFATTSRRGQVLSLDLRDVDRLALVVAKARGFGRVALSVDGVRLQILRTQARRPMIRTVTRVVRFDAPVSGRLRIRSLDAEPIVIDGVGIGQS